MNRLFHMLILGLIAITAQAQLSSNPDKFLGNITTYSNVDDPGNEPFYKLWNLNSDGDVDIAKLIEMILNQK